MRPNVNFEPNRLYRQLEAAYTHLQTQFSELKEKLAISHQTLELIVAHLSEGLIFVSLNGIVSLFNKAAEQLLDCSAEDILNRPFSDYFSDSLFGFSLQDALKKSPIHHRILLTLNGEKEVEVSTSTVPGKGILLLLLDRTEQQKLEISLRQAERLKELGEMAATLAHEIRNPLGGIEGFAQLLKRDLTIDSQQKMVQSILEGTHTLNHLVSNVLDYAKPLQLHFAPTDLVELVKDALSLSPLSSYQLCLEVPHYFISIDKHHIKLVLLNLLRNAAESGATLVEILLKQEGGLVIKDNGCGITKPNFAKIFTPFFTTKARGTGLGLAQALAVVKAHNGTLDVRSEEGQGTEFYLHFKEGALCV